MSKNKVSSRASKIQTGGRAVLFESQQGRLGELESLLAERDAVITNLQRKLAEQGELHLSTVKKLRRERDELRSKNAALVNKLAEVSRKRSVSTVTPPLPRAPIHSSRSSTYRSLPHNTNPPPRIFHHHSAATLPALPSPTNSTPRQAKNVSFLTPSSSKDSDTDYSDLEEEEEKFETTSKNKVIKQQKKMSNSGNGDSIEIDISKELAAVMDSSSNSAAPVLLGYNKKPEEVIKSGRNPSASPPIPRLSHRHDSTSSSGSDGRDASYTIGAVVAEKSSPALLKKTSPSQQWSPKMNGRAKAKVSSSDGVASAIQQILSNKKNSPEKHGAKTASESLNGKTVATNGIRKDISSTNDAKKTRASPEASPNSKTGERSGKRATPSSHRSKEGGVAVTRALFERMSSNSLLEVPLPKEDDGSSSQSTENNSSGNPKAETGKSDDNPSNSLSDEGTTADAESGGDVLSPLVTIPGRSFSDKLAQQDSKGQWSVSASSILMDRNKGFTCSAQNITARDDFVLGEDEEDAVGEMQGAFDCLDVRARTSTVSGSLLKGAARVGIGRKRLKDQRKENLMMKRATSQVAPAGEKDFTGDMDALKHNFELLSPQLEAKIKEMSLRKLYEKYGGKDVVKHAIQVIVQAWQSYRLRKRFQQRLKEKSQSRAKMRERAKSLRNVNRRPSILQKGGREQYRKVKLSAKSENRDASKLASSVTAMDPMARMKEKAERLGKERVGHTHSGARLELMEKKRNSYGINGEAGSVMEEEGKGSSLARDSLASPGASISEDSIDLSRIGAVMDGQNSVDDSVFVPEKKDKKDKKHTLEPSLSVNQIDMQLDSGGMEQCKDIEFGSNRPKFDLSAHMQLCAADAPSSEEGDDEMHDSIQSDGIALSLSASDFQRPVSVFSETSIESSLSVPLYLSAKSERRAGTLPRPGRIRQQSFEDRERTTRMKVGIYHFNRKPTKGIQYLVRNRLLEDDPKKVAEFLVSQDGLCKEKIGEFLGAISNEFNMAVLECLAEHVYVGDKPIDEALREFQQLFRMPGEAQKIDKIMEVFAMEYYKSNKAHGGVFKTEDGAYILSFSIMMLHTSLHNPSVKSRPTKKQWLAQNRGINDGESFPDSLLFEIFDRIQACAFVTGRDHTHVVAEIEKQITGSTIDSLCTSQRFLVHKTMVTEVLELGARSGFRNKHRRQLFLFNDIAIVCKRRSQDQFVFKDTFSLHNLQYITFETSHYKYGVQLHAQDRDTPYQFNCDSRTDRETILQHLEDILEHLNLLESERIQELGNTLVTTTQDSAHATGQTSHAGDLITTRSLTMDTSTLKKTRGDFVDGVGDLAVSLPTSLSRQLSGNRISQDSGFNSHQLTPTPPLSPAPNSLSDTEAGTPGSGTNSMTTKGSSYVGPRSLTPNAPRVTAAAKNDSGLGVSTRPTRSKSTDGIHRLGVTSEAPRSPSMDFPGKRRSSGQASGSSPLVETKKKNKKEKTGKSFFGFGKGKSNKESNGEAAKKEKLKQTMTLSRAERDVSSSPQTHKKLVQTMTDSLDRSLVYSSELTKTLPH